MNHPVGYHEARWRVIIQYMIGLIFVGCVTIGILTVIYFLGG